MKLKKILSVAAASVVAASVVATSASADWASVSDPQNGLSSSSALYMIPLFCNVESPDIPMTDHDLDLSKLGYVSFTIHIPEEERDFFNGQFGGGLGISLHASNIEQPQAPTDEDKTKTAQNGSKYTPWSYYNWDDAANYWGVLDPEAKDPDSYDIDGDYIEGTPTYINYLDPGQTTFLENLGDYTYRVRGRLANPVVEGDCTVEDITDVRVFLQCWNATAFVAEVTRTVVYDLDGNPMIAFDEKGNVVETTADDAKEPVMPEAPVEEDPVEDSTPESTPSDDSAASTPDSTSDDTPATPESSESVAAPASDSSNGLPTGAIIGIVAGVVVVIGVVVGIVIKKKKG